MKIFIIIFILFSSVAIASDFEFEIGGSFGTSADFSYTDGYYLLNSSLNGSRTDLGFTASALISLGGNDKILNKTLTSISYMFETGYNLYIRNRTADVTDDNYNNSYSYHSIILGALFKFNFYNAISFGIGAGVFLPVYSKSKRPEYGLGKYGNITEFNQDKISFMYKLPFMPYIKLNVEKYFYFSEKWAFKIGANILYNFGMEFDNVRLYGDGYYNTYDKYKFSSLAFELVLSMSFGRPK